MAKNEKRQSKGIKGLHINPVIWIVLVTMLYIFSPDISEFVREEGTPSAPDGYPSQVVDELIADDGGFTGNEIIIVYHQEENRSFTEDQKEAIEDRLEELKEKDELEIHDVITPFDSEETEERLLSEDEDLIVAVIQLEIESHEYPELRSTIQDATAVDEVPHYQTGEIVINEDVLISTEEGLNRSTIITVILVFLVLAIVFRSPVAPFIPLVMLGTVYVLSVSFVAILIDRFGFPVSQFTEVFILVVVFGVGTDYCILIMQRFQEEAGNTSDGYQAMKQTMKGARNSILYSAMTGFIGFAAIGLANFELYQSAAGVAFSVLFVIVAMWMLYPFLFFVFGNRIFWPMQSREKKPNNWLWGKLGYFALYKTKYALFIILVATIPLLLTYNNERSFDNLEEIDQSYDSVKAYQLIDDAFGEGNLFFSTLVIESENETWQDVRAIPYLEYVSMNLAKIDRVDDVRTVSRPTGSVVEEAKVPSLAEELQSGLREAIDGLEELSEGQQEMINELEEGESEFDDVEEAMLELIDGVEQLRDGVDEGVAGLEEIQDGLSEGQDGLEEIAVGQQEIISELEGYHDELDQAEQGIMELFDQLEEMNDGLTTMIDGLEEFQAIVDAVDSVDLLDSEVFDQEMIDFFLQNEEEIDESLAQIQEVVEDISVFSDPINELATSMLEVTNTLTEFESVLRTLANDPSEMLDTDESILAELLEQLPENWFEEILPDANTTGDALLGLANFIASLNEQLEASAETIIDLQDELGNFQTNILEELEQLRSMFDRFTDITELFADLEGEIEPTEIPVQLEEMIVGLTTLQEGLSEFLAEDAAIQEQISQFSEAYEQLLAGLSEMNEGTEEIYEGIGEAISGLDEAVLGFSEVGSGLSDIQTGLEEFTQNTDMMREMLYLLIDGLTEMEEGTEEIASGLIEAVDLLGEMVDQSDHPLVGVLFLEEIIESEEFEQVWEQYTTPEEKRVAYLEVELDVNPYSDEAFDLLDEIEEVTAFTLRDTFLEDAPFAIDGLSSNNRDLRDVSNEDFLFTATVMLIGIFLALVILFKSLIIPVYVLISLVLTYYSAMAITEIIFVDWLGYAGVMWATPFFGFVLLMALGVDYSIFLLGRLTDELKEHQEQQEEGNYSEIILDVMKKVGNTVLSAGVILGGTFASLYPAGVLSLMQISTIAIAGIVFYTLILLPLFVPIMFKWIGKYNWWPFK
ncbi:RND superfamily putative drug exporter [Natronobacillus azotifigens]|uniref:MMPL family transporter n=1 Tax=Natronobacillus azotifigens TaxID=472978 RepID=A0A9J6RF69_9BACI|nr:MMPL family transporter [Natronobacillus azotifigens]MCZ0704207.1 MMPL family transporter [Natronobacillus azotifigens]